MTNAPEDEEHVHQPLEEWTAKQEANGYDIVLALTLTRAEVVLDSDGYYIRDPADHDAEHILGPFATREVAEELIAHLAREA